MIATQMAAVHGPTTSDRSREALADTGAVLAATAVSWGQSGLGWHYNALLPRLLGHAPVNFRYADIGSKMQQHPDNPRAFH